MAVDPLLEFLEIESGKYQDLKSKYEEFTDLYSKKLYHQLSLKLSEFVGDGTNLRDGK